MAGDKWRRLRIDEIKAPTPGSIGIGPFGSRMKSDLYVPDGIPVIRGNNISDTRALVGSFVFVSPETADGLRSSNVFPDDLFFPHRGAIGEVGIVPRNCAGRYVLSSSLMKLTCDCSFMDPKFVFYFFRSPEGKHELLKHASTVGTPGIGQPLSSLKAITIPVPSLPEQNAIAQILGTLDDKIELNRRMNETLEAIARALFKSWFVDFDPVRAKAAGLDPNLPKHLADLFPDSFAGSNLAEIPKGWRLTTIGDLSDVVGGSTPSTKEPSYWDGGEHHWATPKDLSALVVPALLETERSITDAGVTQISSGLLPRGTLLLSSRAPIGYLAIAEVPVAINQGFIAMKPKPEVSNLFLLFWTEFSHETILSRANGSTFLEISKGNFRPIPVIAPTKEVMAAFDERVRPLYQRIVEDERESRTLAVLRDALLPKLVSGELRISDPERIGEISS